MAFDTGADSFMKKDITVALLIGFFVGALVAFLLINLPGFLKSKPKTSTSIAQVLPTTSTSQTVTIQIKDIEIINPKDGMVSDNKELKVTGKTKANSIVVFETDSNQFSTLSGSDGNFSQTITLMEGVNNVIISSPLDNGEIKTSMVTVFYTPEKI